MSYDAVVSHRELWRAGSAQMAHVELLHLLFNLSALWSIGIVEQTPTLGPLYYLKITSLLFLLSPLFAMALYHAAIRLAGREEYRTVTSVGYSCVLFGWMTVLAVRRPGGIAVLPLFGVGLPLWLTSFGSLIITSLLIPKASFVGHLAGILAGYLVSVPVVDLIPAWAAIGALVAAAVGLAVSFAAGRQGALADLGIPFLSQWGSGATAADVEAGGGCSEDRNAVY